MTYQINKIMNVYQTYHGEDGCDKFLREVYFPDYSYKGTLIEVGAAGPELYSMSKHFRENKWRCISVEPIPYFAKLHRDVGHEIIECACSDKDEDDVDFQMVNCYRSGAPEKPTGFTFEGNSSFKVREEFAGKVTEFANGIGDITNIKVKARKLNTIIEEHCPNIQIDTVFVDVEGWELTVLKGFDLDKYKPKVLVIENVLHDPEYTRYLESFGYSIKFKTSYNYLYERMRD